MSIQIYQYWYRKKYRPHTYIGISWSHIGLTLIQFYLLYSLNSMLLHSIHCILHILLHALIWIQRIAFYYLYYMHCILCPSLYVLNSIHCCLCISPCITFNSLHLCITLFVIFKSYHLMHLNLNHIIWIVLCTLLIALKAMHSMH